MRSEFDIVPLMKRPRSGRRTSRFLVDVTDDHSGTGRCDVLVHRERIPEWPLGL